MPKPFEFLNFDPLAAIPVPNAPKETVMTPPTARPVTSIMNAPTKHNNAPLTKYEREYDAYCRWASLPEQERKPKTAAAFETKWKVAKGYSSEFRTRADFKQKVIGYWYEWLLEKWPTVAYAAYQQAVKGNSQHIKIFSDLIAKYMDIEKPKATIQPFMIVGVSQDKINSLFVPDDIKEVVEGEVVK